MKAMEKDRTRRYETANDLAADIVRHLNHEPIVASPPSTFYRLRKFVRRNKAPMATVALLATVLVAGLVATTWQAIRATQAERRAIDARAQEAAARQKAVRAREDADQQARQAGAAAAEATEARKDTDRYLYVAHMNLAHQAYETHNNVPRTLELLNSHMPTNGEEDLRDFEWYHLMHLCRKAQATVTLKDSTAIGAVSYSPNGRWLATGGHDGHVRLWDLETLNTAKVFEGHVQMLRCVAFSRDSALLASACVDGSIKIWDVASGKEVVTLAEHAFVVWSVAFSPDGALLASTGQDRTIKFWDVKTWELQRTISGSKTNPEGHRSTINALVFSPDGKTLATAGMDKTVRLWNTSTGELLRIMEGHTGWIRAIAFSPSGETVASGSMDATIRLWNVASGQHHSTLLGHTSEVTSVTFRDDNTLASGSGNNIAKVWDVTTRQSRTFKGHGSVIWSVAFSPDGLQLASGSYDQTVKLWDLAKPDQPNTIDAYTATVGNSLVFSADSKSLVVASPGKPVRVYDVETCAEIRGRRFDHRANHIMLSRDGKRLMSGEPWGSTKLWDFESGKQLKALSGLYPVLSRDGRTLVFGSRDGQIRLWDIEKDKQSKVLDAHGSMCGGMLLSDGRTLASAEMLKGTIKLWDIPTDTLRFTEETGRMMWGGSAESFDGKFLATGIGPSVRVWDLTTFEELPPFEGHAADVLSVKFSSDGKRLVTGGQDGTVRLWDVETREPLLTLWASPGLTHCVAISPDGETLAAASESDSTVRLWRAPRDETHSGMIHE